MNAGNLKAAAAYLGQSAVLFHPARLMDQAFYHWNRGHLAWLQGDMGGACEQARQCVAIATQFGSTFHNLMTPISLAKILVETGEYREASEVIEKILPVIREVDNPTLEYECLLVVAKSAYAQDDDKAGIEALGEALTIMREHGAESTIWWDPLWIVPLFARALGAHIEVEYVQSLIHKHNLIPDAQLTGLEQWPWPIKIQTFGGLTLFINGNPLQSGGKGQKKPIELLTALVAFGGRNVGETQVTDALWPDAEGDDARNSLKTTVHRLRKLLGNEKAIQVENGKLSLNAYYCWTDVWEFERLLNPQDEANIKEIEEAVRLERAINLYKGSFLNTNGEESWLLVPRERLRSQYLRAVELLGRCWEESGSWDQAIECYERGISGDDLAEPFYLRLMACHTRLGHRGEALATYERYRKVLATRFGVEPSAEVQAMASQLQS
jgi:DNA-binding SARP family transcriptional activator